MLVLLPGHVGVGGAAARLPGRRHRHRRRGQPLVGGRCVGAGAAPVDGGGVRERRLAPGLPLLLPRAPHPTMRQPALSSSKLSRSRYQVPPRARAYAPRQWRRAPCRAHLLLQCGAMRCSGALLRSSAGPDRARDEARGLCVWCVGLRARCAFRAGGSGVALLVRAPLGVSVSGRRGAGGFKKFGSSIGKSDRWPGFTFQRQKLRWNGTGGRHRQQQQQRATGVVGERRGNNETAGSA